MEWRDDEETQVQKLYMNSGDETETDVDDDDNPTFLR